jgi:hypothetical protein
LTVLHKVRGRVQVTNSGRLFFIQLIQLYRWFPVILKAMTIIRPETLVLRALIRRMSIENMLWGAPRIHGELLWASRWLIISRPSPSTWPR